VRHHSTLTSSTHVAATGDTATVGAVAETHCYSLAAASADRIRLWVVLTSGTLNPSTEVVRPNGTTLCAATTLDDFNCTLTTNGTHTITIRASRPDRTIADLFAMPFTAPIPPSPSDPAAPLGVATGHPWKDGPGYGPFQVATGPYMFEGAGELDPSAPAAQQHPPAGMALEEDTDNHFYDIPGTITLVRNPSWAAATDPLRPAYAERIEISMLPDKDPYAELAAGRTDTVIGEDPPPAVIRRYTTDPALQDRIVNSARAVTYFGTLNVAQPPFDDIHVRRAVIALMDPNTLARLFAMTDSPGAASTHVVPDPLDAARLASWYPADPAPVGSGLATARSEMRASRYGSHGRCAGAACTVTAEIQPGFNMSDADIPPAERYLRTALERIGIRPTFIVTPDYPKPDPCWLPQRHVALCTLGGWGVDYPDAGNMFVPFLAPGSGPSPTLLGSTPDQLRSWDYKVRVVPAIDGDYARCAALEAGQASLCWARLDQLVTTGLAAAFPAWTPNAIRVYSARVTAFSLDQAFSEPSLDRVAVAG
jgi:hypothetical protein